MRFMSFNTSLGVARSRSNYILGFAGLANLSSQVFQSFITCEIGHGELSHIPQGIPTRIFNDFFWSPIHSQLLGLNSSR